MTKNKRDTIKTPSSYYTKKHIEKENILNDNITMIEEKLYEYRNDDWVSKTFITSFFIFLISIEDVFFS